MGRLASISSLSALSVLSLSVATGLLSTAAVAASSAPTARPLATPAAVAGTQTATTLVTGERVRVRVTATGRTLVDAVPVIRHGAGGSLRTLRAGKDDYVLPATAIPYLGRLLDLNLFNVTKLSAAGGATRLPVRLTFTGATPSVPGITLTSTTAGAASGYLTPKSAQAFGAALAAQYASDAKAKWPARTSLFGATKIAADVAGSPVVSPLFPMRTLILHVLDETGAPAPFALIGLVNAEDARKYVGFAIVVDGEARVSVPVGTYSGITLVDSFDGTGVYTGTREDAVGEYVVSTQNQTLTFDARHATAALAINTPKPADLSAKTFDWERTDAAGFGGIGFGVGTAGEPLLVTPQPAPALGTLTSSAAFSLAGSPIGGTPYTYDAAYGPDQGVPAKESYTLAATEIQTLRPTYFVDALPREGAVTRIILNPGQLSGLGIGQPLGLPSSRIEYVRGEPGAVRLDTLFASPDNYTNPFASLVDDGPRLVVPGQSSKADWLRAPHLPQVPSATDGAAAFGGWDCLACRTADTLRVVISPAQDTTPGHDIAVFASADGTPVARFQIFRDGTSIFDQPDTAGAEVPVPAGRATYRIVDDVNRAPSLALQSVTSHTELTFVSAASDGGTLPGTWSCSLGSDCQILPLLRAAVTLPVNLRGSVPIGPSTIRLNLTHIHGARRPAITCGSVEVRIGGGSWTSLPVIRSSDGTYTAALKTTPEQASQSVDLRVSGTDAAGGSIVQTVTKAFAVSGS